MRILFVEDDDGQLNMFSDALDDWNAAHHDLQISAVTCKTVEQAQEHLSDRRFDCAIFDLKLPTSAPGSDRLGGNILARIGLEQYGIPVGIISANPEDADGDFPANELVCRFVKRGSAAYESAISWFASQWDMMRVLAEARSRIDRSGAEIFAKRIWPRWVNYKALEGDGSADLAMVVTRQYASHVAELLGIDSPANPGWHPFECYIYPALLDNRAHTGDLFKIDDEVWVVISPQCDMAASVETVLMAKCESGIADWELKVGELNKIAQGSEVPQKLKSWFVKFVNQNIEVSKHFLPPLAKEGPMLVNFRKVSTRPIAELNAMLPSRLASIAPAFLSNLTQRFGAYISRTGQPNISVRHFGDTGG